MPGLQGDTVMAALGSPIKKSKLSLKFFQKKETKRALDFSETQVEEQAANPVGCEEPASCDQSVPALCSPSPSGCEKKEDLVPFVGFNNLGNTCYLNSILQVLYYCPGFKDVIKKLYKLSKSREKQTERSVRDEEEGADLDEQDPAHMELLGSFYNLITSVELLQSSFLRNPDKYSEGDLATPPRRVLHTLRQLNPMYEGYLQHDAQEVLQCILGYIQEACETIGKEQNSEAAGQRAQGDADKSLTEDDDGGDGPLSGKRKSDTEAGNAKKRPKSQSRTKKRVEEQQHFTRSKRKSCGDITVEPSSPTEQPTDKVEKEKEQVSDTEGKDCTEEVGKTKKRARLSWLKPSGKQPSIFSKFCSMGRLSSHTGSKTEGRQDHEKVNGEHQEIKEKSEVGPDKKKPTVVENQSKVLSEEDLGLDMLKHLFQGQLVLRTRCLECECYTERREDFQDISVPVQEDEAEKPETSYEISPEPKSELKTLNWAISQFASVERIVGEDKYFCETCQHYTEAERSLLFDKMPEVITIHLKCFAANSTELDPYAGLSKVNTPLRTPLKLSLDEWSTGPVAGGHQYELFAVVMHSGVTISSGHYTTYIRMMGLHNTQLREEEEVEAGQKAKSLKREELQDYDDGEVSFSVGGRGQNANTAAVSVTTSSKAAGKKLLEGVGLLGGQRSLTSYELGAGKQTTHDKTATVPPSCSSDSQLHNGGIKKDVGTAKDQGPNTNHQALQNLLDYEGKWMLFDDSEVRLYMEEDFLRACSPETSSTSTPYLLFYRKTQQQQK